MPLRSKTTIQSLQDLDKWVSEITPLFQPKSVICLSGALGAGKTTLVQHLLKPFGFDSVSSPTYALHQHYKLPSFDVDHFDLYRVESADELESVGFWDVFVKLNGWIIIEWPERLDVSELPKDWSVFWIRISVETDGRHIDFKLPHHAVDKPK